MNLKEALLIGRTASYTNFDGLGVDNGIVLESANKKEMTDFFNGFIENMQAISNSQKENNMDQVCFLTLKITNKEVYTRQIICNQKNIKDFKEIVFQVINKKF